MMYTGTPEQQAACLCARWCVACSAQENLFRFISRSPDGAHSDESTPDPSQAIYAEFDDDFEDEELTAPIGKCTAMYNFPGMSQAVPADCITPRSWRAQCA